MAFCTNCGADSAAAFCEKCGTKMNAAPAAPAAKKGMSPVMIILLIVGGLMVLGFIGVVGTGMFVARKVQQVGANPGLALSKLILASNPDVEVLKVDDSANTISVRDKKTGKVTTMNFDDVKSGKFTMTESDGRGGTASVQIGADAGQLPSWVPQYPGSTPTGTFAAKSAGEEGVDGGSFSYSTSDDATKVTDFYQQQAKTSGLKVASSTVTPAGGMLALADQVEKRSMMVILTGGGGSTNVSVTYSSKK